MTARKNRGSGNNNLKAWDSPLWDSIEKPTGDCKHLNTKFTNGVPSLQELRRGTLKKNRRGNYVRV